MAAAPTPATPVPVNLKNQITAFQRTVVSFIIGFGITQAARIGLQLNDPAFVAALTVMIGGAWYAVFHYAETKWNAGWGWMLGKVGAPRYKAVEVVLEPVVAPVVAAAVVEASAALEKAQTVIEEHTPPLPPAPPVA